MSISKHAAEAVRPSSAVNQPDISLHSVQEEKVCVAALYKFVTLADYEALKPTILKQLLDREIRGTLLLALEGINGTISGDKGQLDEFLAWLTQDPRFDGLDYKLSYHLEQPFNRTKVKLKREIVTMGVDHIDPNQVVGPMLKLRSGTNLSATLTHY